MCVHTFVVFHTCITKMHMTLLWVFSSHWDWVLFVSHSTPTFKQCIRNIKTSQNNVLMVCFFSIFFSTYFASSAPSPMMLPPSPNPHLQTTYQEHQSKPKRCPMMLFGLMVCFQGMLFLTDITFQLTACIFGLHNAFLTPSFNHNLSCTL